MPKIEQLPSGSFRARVYAGTDPDGKKRYKSITGNSKKDVKLKIAEYEMSQNKNKYSTNMTVRDAIKKYIEDRNAVISPATIKGYYTILNNRLKDIMDVKICNLTKANIQAAFNKDAERLKHKTIMNTHGLFNAALTTIDESLTFNITFPEEEEVEIVIPTEEEMQKIFKSAKGKTIETAIYLAAMLGMRRSEIAALKWEDIDFDKKIMHIHTAEVIDVDNKIITKGTKKISSTRTVRIFEPVLQHLKSLPRDSEYVHKFKSPNNITHQFEYLLKKAGVPSYRFHDLRHYAVSAMLLVDMPKKYIASFVGHKTTYMIDKIYGHIMRDKKYQIMDAVDAYFSENFAKDDTKDDTE